MTEKKHLLDMQDVSIVFGGLRAVSNVNLSWKSKQVS